MRLSVELVEGVFFLFLFVHFRDFLVDPESKREGKQCYNSCLNMWKLHFISCLICAINDCKSIKRNKSNAISFRLIECKILSPDIDLLFLENTAIVASSRGH